MQDQENKELRMKLKRQLTFKNEMDNISKNYAQFEQQIYYSPLKNINPNMIIKIEAKQPKQQNKKSTIFGKRQDFYMINGQFQPQGDKSFEKLILQIVQTIPRPTKPFGMIYINTFADGSAYNDFKKVLQLLPIQYFFNLTKIYVLQPSFFNKTSFWFSFGTITNYIKNKTINIDYIQDLSKHTKFDLDYLLKLLPKNVSIYFKEIEIKAANLRREQQQNRKYVQLKFLADRKSQLAQNPKIVSYESSIFEACLPQNLQKVKSDQTYGFNPQSTGDLASKSEVKRNNNQKKIQEYQLGPTGAPIILQLLIYYFNSKQQALKLQGIFRKSVSIDDQTEILAQLHHKNYNCIEKIDNPHVIANAIKRFLANLKIPLINFELFNYFMTLEQNQKLHPLVVQKIKQLPKINRMTLFILFDFLMNKVLKYAEMSKMSLNNLCIVFGPCLMRSEVASIKDLIYAKKIITITNVFFIQFQSIFGSTHEQNKLKRASYKQYKKEDMMHKIIVSPPKQQKPIEIAQHNADIKQKSQNVQKLGQLNLMNRTSQFIKQSLEIDEDDEQTDSIGQEQAKAVIMLSNQMKIEIGQIQESIPKQKNIASSHFKFDSSIGTSSSHPKLHEQNNKSNNTINI